MRVIKKKEGYSQNRGKRREKSPVKLILPDFYTQCRFIDKIRAKKASEEIYISLFMLNLSHENLVLLV